MLLLECLYLVHLPASFSDLLLLFFFVQELKEASPILQSFSEQHLSALQYLSQQYSTLFADTQLLATRYQELHRLTSTIQNLDQQASACVAQFTDQQTTLRTQLQPLRMSIAQLMNDPSVMMMLKKKEQ